MADVTEEEPPVAPKLKLSNLDSGFAPRDVAFLLFYVALSLLVLLMVSKSEKQPLLSVLLDSSKESLEEGLSLSDPWQILMEMLPTWNDIKELVFEQDHFEVFFPAGVFFCVCLVLFVFLSIASHLLVWMAVIVPLAATAFVCYDFKEHLINFPHDPRACYFVSSVLFLATFVVIASFTSLWKRLNFTAAVLRLGASAILHRPVLLFLPPLLHAIFQVYARWIHVHIAKVNIWTALDNLQTGTASNSDLTSLVQVSVLSFHLTLTFSTLCGFLALVTSRTIARWLLNQPRSNAFTVLIETLFTSFGTAVMAGVAMFIIQKLGELLRFVIQEIPILNVVLAPVVWLIQWLVHFLNIVVCLVAGITGEGYWRSVELSAHIIHENATTFALVTSYTSFITHSFMCVSAAGTIYAVTILNNTPTPSAHSLSVVIIICLYANVILWSLVQIAALTVMLTALYIRERLGSLDSLVDVMQAPVKDLLDNQPPAEHHRNILWSILFWLGIFTVVSFGVHHFNLAADVNNYLLFVQEMIKDL